VSDGAAPSRRADDSRRSRVGSLTALVGLLLVAVILLGSAAYAVLRDNGGAADPDSASSSSGGYKVHQGDERKAIRSFSGALVEELGITKDQADCLAFQVIRGVGLQRMVDIGMFDREMTFQDVDLAEHPDVKDAISTAASTCVRPG
jgi:hypothetical protein